MSELSIPEEESSWQIAATMELLTTAIIAETALDPEEGRKSVCQALIEFADAVDAHGGDDRDWFGLALGLAEAAKSFAPEGAFGPGDGPTVAVMEDTLTGRAVEDPDAEADDAGSAAALAAMRIVAAVVDDNIDLAHDVFHAIMPTDAAPMMTMLLAEYAAGMVIGKGEREGTLTPDTQARLDQRRAMLPPEPEPAKVRTASTGTRYTSMPIGDEDKGENALIAAPHGHGHYAVGMYVPGVTGHRDAVIATLHREIGAGALGEGDLCGIQHEEDVEVWQIPHSARRHTNREMRSQKRQYGRPVQLVRGWQHTGACGGAE